MFNTVQVLMTLAPPMSDPNLSQTTTLELRGGNLGVTCYPLSRHYVILKLLWLQIRSSIMMHAITRPWNGKQALISKTAGTWSFMPRKQF
jgi:hypothetical protein